jgi:hypothetical protein
LNAFAIPGSVDRIVVLNCDDRPSDVEEWHPFPNVVSVKPNGDVVWTAELPAGETLKSYTAARWDGGQLVAHSWSYRCTLDAASGRLLSVESTK